MMALILLVGAFLTLRLRDVKELAGEQPWS